MKKKELILNPVFILGLILLILNDFYFKYQFSNWLTGKLSDFAGLLIFPIFIAVVFPRFKRYAALFAGIVFFIWKLPLVTPFIDWFNSFQIHFKLSRVIDYTDYIAFVVLPLSQYLINGRKGFGNISMLMPHFRTFCRVSLLIVAFFSFCATSVYRTEMPRGTIYIGKSYTIKLPKDSVISSIRAMGYNCDFKEDTVGSTNGYFTGYTSFYQTDNLIRNWKESTHTDTISNVKYLLHEATSNKTRIEIINVTLPKDGNVQNWRYLKGLSRTYKEWLKSNFVEKID